MNSTDPIKYSDQYITSLERTKSLLDAFNSLLYDYSVKLYCNSLDNDTLIDCEYEGLRQSTDENVKILLNTMFHISLAVDKLAVRLARLSPEQDTNNLE